MSHCCPPPQVLSKEQSIELFTEYPEAHSTICSNLLLDFDLTLEGMPIPGVEDDLSDKEKLETKACILKVMKHKLEQRFFMLCQAARSGDSETVAILARQGANLNQHDYDGRTAIHIASREGHYKVVEVLLEHNANPNPKDRWGQV